MAERVMWPIILYPVTSSPSHDPAGHVRLERGAVLEGEGVPHKEWDDNDDNTYMTP